MLAAELGNETIVALLAENQANLRLMDAEGKGTLSKTSLGTSVTCPNVGGFKGEAV